MKRIMFAVLLLAVPVQAQVIDGDSSVGAHKIGADSPYIPSQKDLQLLTAFREGSSESLDQFFEEWEKLSIPITTVELEDLEPLEQTIYELFLFLYEPYGYDEQKYLAVQNEIDYRIVAAEAINSATSLLEFGIYEPTKMTTLTDFRPPVVLENHLILYLTDEYERALNFLMNENDGRVVKVKDDVSEALEAKSSFLYGCV